MRNKILPVILGVIVTLSLTVGLMASQASATDPITRLTHKVTALSNRLAKLQRKVTFLSDEVYRCEFYDTSTPTSFTDGSIGYPLYENSTCT